MAGVAGSAARGRKALAGKRNVAALWMAWSRQQHLTGPTAMPDYANAEQMDRFT